MAKTKILIGALIVLLFFTVFIVWIRMFHTLKAEEYLGQKKTVICVKINDAEDSIMVVNEISLDDCGENLISYNEDKQTLLYINQKRELIERDINGEISYNAAVLRYNDLQNDESSNIYNLQYMSADNEISFICNHSLYCFDCIKDQSYKLVESCAGSTWCNTYWLQSVEEIYFIDYDKDQQQKNLYFQDKQQEIRLVEKGVESFCVSSDGTRLYCIQGYIVPNIFGFNTKYRIIEVDLLHGRNRILREISSDNFILRNVDNKFLLYVEESNERERAKVFQLNLQSGKTKFIYRTNRKVIGIVIGD